MNCDQAFNVMTSADRMGSLALSEHLSVCPRCRQMLETLEPALGLFEKIGLPATETLTRQSPSARTSSVHMAQQVAARLTPATQSPAIQPTRTRLWGAMLAVTAVGFLLGWSFTLLVPATGASTPEASSACAWLNRSMLSDGVRATTVAATCVSCHLPPQATSDADHAGVFDVSRELERMLARWSVNGDQPAGKFVLIAKAINDSKSGGSSPDRYQRRVSFHFLQAA